MQRLSIYQIDWYIIQSFDRPEAYNLLDNTIVFDSKKL